MKKKKSEDTYTVRLRTAAEELLHSREINEDDRKKGLDEIFQELQVYQIELELQNDELSLANEDLEWQRLRFTNIYELAPVGYFILTRTGMISEVNAAALQLLGTGSSSVTGRLFHHFVDSDSLDTFYLFFRKLISSYKNDGCTLKLSVKNGKPFHVRLEGIYLKQINQCYLAVLDLTEIIEIRGKLAETNERLQMAMEASLAGTWELNPESMAFKFDDLGYRFCRVDEDRFGGDYNSFLKLVHPDDRSMVDFQFRTAFNTSKKLDLVCRLANPENEQCFAGLRGHMLRRADGREVLIGIIMDYSEKKRLEAEAEQLRSEHQKEINAAVLTAEENERKRMSEALHDSVGQLLYGVKLQLSQLNSSGQPDVTKQINDLLDTAIRETRNLSFELSPAILVDFGLKDALEELARRLSLPNFHIVPDVKGFRGRLDLTLETYIFRIVQELINNCMKHANATSVQINININKKITIEVIDNGQGFLVKTTGKPKGTGFSSIRNRISVYNGSFHVDSEPGKGTQVKVVLNF